MDMLLQAWFRRGKANASLGDYEDSVRDLSISIKLEKSMGGKRQIQIEMETILDQSKEMSGSQQQSNERYLDMNGNSFGTRRYIILLFLHMSSLSLLVHIKKIFNCFSSFIFL